MPLIILHGHSDLSSLSFCQLVCSSRFFIIVIVGVVIIFVWHARRLSASLVTRSFMASKSSVKWLLRRDLELAIHERFLSVITWRMSNYFNCCHCLVQDSNYSHYCHQSCPKAFVYLTTYVVNASLAEMVIFIFGFINISISFYILKWF